jgi:hypothetical protein
MRGFQLIPMVAIIRSDGQLKSMTDEERERAMDFIVEQQAKLSVAQQKGEERTSGWSAL